MTVDVWAHAFADNPKLADEVVNEDFADDLAAMENGEWETIADDHYGDVR